MRVSAIAVIAAAMITGSACTSKASNNTASSKNATAAVEQADTTSLGDEEELLPNGESLNDIRFAGWTEKEWISNPYLDCLRQYFDDVAAGKVSDTVLDPHKKALKGKFVAGNIAPFIMGGLMITVQLIDAPTVILNCWVYSDVDTEKRKVVGYHVNDVSVNQDIKPSAAEAAEMLEGIENYPEFVH